MTFEPNHDHETALRIARAELTKRVLILLTFVLVVGLVALLGVVLQRQGETIDEIRATQQKGSPVVLRLEALTQTIQSCVTPGQPCYDASQARTADAVGSINDTVQATVACADRLGQQSLPTIRECVLETLAAREE